MIARYLRALKSVWLATLNARNISATTLGTFLFFAANKARRWQLLPFRFHAGAYPFWARPADFCAVEEVLLNHEYAFAARVVAEAASDPVVIDGGANIGAFSITILTSRPDARIHSLEPGRRTFEILRRNAQASGQTGWQAYQLALWKENGTIAFATRTASTASRVYEIEPEGEPESVPAITLDSFIARHISGRVTLLKLDIEGSEEIVLTQSESVLPRVDNLIIEIHPDLVAEDRVMALIGAHFPYLHRAPGRQSSKPLIFASRTYAEFPA